MKLNLTLALFGVLFVASAAWPIMAFATAPPAKDDHAAHAPAPPSKIGAPQAPPAHHEPATTENHNNGEPPEGEEGSGDHPPDPRGINWIDLHDPPYATAHAKYGPRPPYGAMLLNFVLLAALYYFLGRKPIANALVARRAAVAKEIEEAQRMKKEAEARAKQYQAKLGHLEEELATAKQALVDAGRGERDRIVRDAEEKAARMEKDATFRIEQEMRQIRQELWRDTVEVAVTAAEDLLKKRITPADQERLAEDYLAELGSAGGAS